MRRECKCYSWPIAVSWFYNSPSKITPGPTQGIEVLGFILNSVEMKIKLTDYKAGKINSKIKKLLYEEKQTIQELASVIESLVATFKVFLMVSFFTGN